jgi:hypothetical protein
LSGQNNTQPLEISGGGGGEELIIIRN